MQAPVSVIIPCYLCADTIERAVESVVGQTFLPGEILLVDDCSGDEGNTLSVLFLLQQKYQHKVPVSVIKLPENSGPGAARNAGWKAAQQTYLAFLDADDRWHPRKLEIQYQWMAAHPEVYLTGHQSRCIMSCEQAVSNVINTVRAHHIGRLEFLLSNSLPTRSVMLNREKIAYRFDPDKRYAEDYLLWLTIILNGHAAWKLEAPLAYSYKADFGESGLSGKLWKMEKGELDTYKRIYQQKKILTASFIGLVIFSLLKYLRRLILNYTTRFFSKRSFQ